MIDVLAVIYKSRIKITVFLITQSSGLKLKYPIDEPHQRGGTDQRIDHSTVVFFVRTSQFTALAIFEPFLCGLIATDVEIESGFGDVAKKLIVIDEHASSVWFTRTICELPIGFDDFAGDGIVGLPLCFEVIECRAQFLIVKSRIVEQVNRPQLSTELNQRPKDFDIGRVGHTREIDFEEFLVRFAVAWAVQHGVGVVEHVNGGKHFFVLIARLLVDKSQAQLIGKSGDDFGIEVWHAWAGNAVYGGFWVGVEGE